MLNLLLEFIVKFLGYALPSTIRWRYSAIRLAGMLKVRIRESGDGIVFRGGEMPNAQAWLRITNLSPFPITIDRIYGHFWYGTQLAAYQDLGQHTVPPSGEIEVLVEAALTQPQEAYIVKNQTEMNAKLILSALCKSNIREFELLYREVETNHARLVNFTKPQQRVAADARTSLG